MCHPPKPTVDGVDADDFIEIDAIVDAIVDVVDDDDALSRKLGERLSKIGATPPESSPTLELLLLKEIPSVRPAIRAVKLVRRNFKRLAGLAAENAKLQRQLTWVTRKAAIVELTRRGKGVHEIAAELGLSPPQVSQTLGLIRADYAALENSRALPRPRSRVTPVKNVPSTVAEMFSMEGETPPSEDAPQEGSNEDEPLFTAEDGTQFVPDWDALLGAFGDDPEK